MHPFLEPLLTPEIEYPRARKMNDAFRDPHSKRPFLSKGEYVYQLLKEKIRNGYLEKNKIYTIVEIAESLGVSRTPVCEAVKILGAQNLIFLQQGVGFKVRELSIDEVREDLTIAGALEEAVLRKIIQDETDPTAELLAALQKSWRAVEDRAPELYTQASADFHKALYSLSKQPKVIEILQENVFVHEIWYRQGAKDYPEEVKRLVCDHENIVGLIEHRDYGRITEVITGHVQNCEAILTKVIEDERINK
jgi:DNA-binding GntR family transcriptional regulator